jgi:hypothetical protein
MTEEPEPTPAESPPAPPEPKPAPTVVGTAVRAGFRAALLTGTAFAVLAIGACFFINLVPRNDWLAKFLGGKLAAQVMFVAPFSIIGAALAGVLSFLLALLAGLVQSRQKRD